MWWVRHDGGRGGKRRFIVRRFSPSERVGPIRMTSQEVAKVGRSLLHNTSSGVADDEWWFGFGSRYCDVSVVDKGQT